MKEKEKSLIKNPTGRYVTIEEAAAEAGVAERTIQRWKKGGKVHVIRDRLNHVRVSLEDVLACRKDQSDSPLRSQVQRLQTEIALLSQHMVTLQQQMEELRHQHDLGEQLLQALTSSSGEAMETPVWSQFVTLFAERRSRSSGRGLAAMLAKRGLPQDGTLRLSDFAKDHHISIHEIKKLYDTGTIGLTVYERPGEHQRNKKEWWISKPEQESLIAYWQQHGLSYTACTQCPHHVTPKAHAS